MKSQKDIRASESSEINVGLEEILNRINSFIKLAKRGIPLITTDTFPSRYTKKQRTPEQNRC